jgi:hypothetical protein
MSDNDTLAAAIFVAVALALTGLFDFLARRWKRR